MSSLSKHSYYIGGELCKRSAGYLGKNGAKIHNTFSVAQIKTSLRDTEELLIFINFLSFSCKMIERIYKNMYIQKDKTKYADKTNRKI